MQADVVRTRIVTAALAILIGGCGAEGPVTYKLSGTVSFDGQPVPKGLVTLTPEVGLETQIAIENGLFVTPEGRGIGGGPHRVKIVGFDGIPTRWQGEDLPDGRSLFSPYRASVDFPPQDGEYHFAISKSTGSTGAVSPTPTSPFGR